MNSKISLFLAFICIILAVVILLPATRIIPTRAETTTPPQELESEGPSEPDSSPFTCTINNIGVFTNRIHVKCSPGDGAIAYFATSAVPSNQLYANRMLTILNTGFALGKKVIIYYNSSSANNPSGCAASDCRKMTDIILLP